MKEVEFDKKISDNVRFKSDCMRVFCEVCGKVYEYPLSRSPIWQLLNENWDLVDDKLACPECGEGK